MANHSKRVPTLRSLSKRQWMKITAVVAATGMLAGAGIVSRNFYAASQHAAQSQVTSYSATDADALQVSRGEARESGRGAARGAWRSSAVAFFFFARRPPGGRPQPARPPPPTNPQPPPRGLGAPPRAAASR